MADYPGLRGDLADELREIDITRRALPADERQRLEAADAPMLRIQLAYQMQTNDRLRDVVRVLLDALGDRPDHAHPRHHRGDPPCLTCLTPWSATWSSARPTAPPP